MVLLTTLKQVTLVKIEQQALPTQPWTGLANRMAFELGVGGVSLWCVFCEMLWKLGGFEIKGCPFMFCWAGNWNKRWFAWKTEHLADLVGIPGTLGLCI